MDVSEILKVTEYLILGSNLFVESVIDLAVKKCCLVIMHKAHVLPFNHLKMYICLFVSPQSHHRGGGNVLFNDALNTFYFGYMASDIW